MTKGAHMWGKVGAPVQSFTPICQRECGPRWEQMPMQLMAAVNVVVKTSSNMKLPFMPAAANARFPPAASDQHRNGGRCYTVLSA
jgi:hypothetical protein